MVFGEIRYREPARLLRPDRDRRYACASYHVPGPNDLPIFVDHRTADAMERHALSDTKVELGGILLGKECVDEATGAPFVWVSQSLEAKHYANTQASFTYTHDSWEEITRERDRLHADLDIVGWYHTHPSFGIFLSHHDLFIHQHFFAQPLQVAYVIDPIQHTRGFFQWRGDSMAQVQGFYLIADRGDRLALARIANDLENLPSPQGQGGSALSPRLEAELIKMLTRPSIPQYANSPVDRLQAAAIFGVLGSFLGILGVAAALWLYQLHGQIQEQGEALKSLRDSVSQVSGGQRLALDTLLERAGVEKRAEFMERYEVASRARDEARKQLAAQQSINEVLVTRAGMLEGQVKKLSSELEEDRKLVERYEADAKDAPDLRQSVNKLTSELEEKSKIAESVEGQKFADLLQRLNFYRYVAYFCGALSLLLVLAVVYLCYRPISGPEPGTPEPLPHRIT